MTAEETPIAPPAPAADAAPAVQAEQVEKKEVTVGEKRPRDESDEVVKKAKIEGGESTEYRYGVAPIKAEFRINNTPKAPAVDDDAAEAGTTTVTSDAPVNPPDARDARDNRDARGGRGGRKEKNQKKERGQNKGRKFQFEKDKIVLCPYVAFAPSTKIEIAKPLCKYIGDCKNEHDIKRYLKEGKKEDFEGVCPVFEAVGECGGPVGGSGWKCRWLKSHVRPLEEGSDELELVVDQEKKKAYLEKEEAFVNGRKKITSFNKKDGTPFYEDVSKNTFGEDTMDKEVINTVDMKHKIQFRKKAFKLPKSEEYLAWLDKQTSDPTVDLLDNRAAFIDCPFRPSEKRPLYISAETPILAPLTTTGNLPFRRLCAQLGASITYSEMAVSAPLLQGHKPEWALARAHLTETPAFGIQLCASKPWQALKATEALTTLLPPRGLSFIDLNCGCPIDLVYKQGAGSALLDQQAKLLKMIRGMNYVSGSTPITIKIRMGTKDASPTAQKLITKLIKAGDVASITLHGRSRQQRYSRAADWSYIAETSALITRVKAELADFVDTAEFKEKSDMPQATGSSTSGEGFGGWNGSSPYFIGNGDCYSQADYYDHTTNAGVDSVMIARGALIKPWIFEEIEKKQYLDKTSTERFEYIKQFAANGLSHWGSDEFGIDTTRRFLCEWLSFTYRYVPIGLLERLPPRLNDRPPAWKGRDEMETLMGSDKASDWVKISEMVLGKCKEGYGFVPKHRSNAYPTEGGDEMEAEG
ncbi:FMN-linked oxidoreductase [Ascobolus immersus RN42]|uniref:tRNA-dihydrouridine(47) synthase [NAD(P)(+)] n=1 Tax=Ascobolus immersus RN42 TaxID=1160509 RepID=A0A3N4HS91_ASCIM|nr:FMN-linked oxidoreductase [Ascobolus immersus RN42]